MRSVLWSLGPGVGVSFKEWRVLGAAAAVPYPHSPAQVQVPLSGRKCPECGKGRRKPQQEAGNAAGDEDWLAKKGKVDSIGRAGVGGR